MKSKPSAFLILFCMALLPAQSVLSQVVDSRPRRVSMRPAPISKNLVDVDKSAAEDAAFTAMIPRDGLKFYFEVRNGGLAQLAGASSASASLPSLLSLGGKGIDKNELAGFVLRNLGALSASRLALAGYGRDGAALLIEAAGADDAERLRAEIERLFAAGETGMVVRSQDRRVVAGARSTVNRLLEGGGTSTLADDGEFVKAQSRFSSDPFFAYVETGASLMPLPAGGGNNPGDGAALAGMLAAFGPLPYGVAIGGQVHSDSVSLRALVMYDKSRKQGLFSSILAATQMGQLSASGFAASDTELFVDLMIDWDKLYEALESLFATFLSAAQASGNSQQRAEMPRPVDLLAAVESSLGFSIRNDLIPTLGNEVAISLSGFGELMRPKSSGAAARKGAPRILFMLALRDPIKFEQLFARLFSPKGGRAPRPFARVSYRGATIRHNKDLAYTITEGFLIAGPGVAEIRRAMDARALNTSLASRPEFASAMGASRPVMLQAYLSPAVSGSLLESVLKGAARGASAPVALTMMADEDGFLMEMQVPTELALAGLASMAANRPAPYGITSSPTSGARRSSSRRSPTLTNDDLIHRKP